MTIGWPSDVSSWDPVERTVPDSQPIFKLVFDQPVDQAPDLSIVPRLVTAWKQSDDGKTLTLDFRDDVHFHDGSLMTSEDFRYTFFERVKSGHKIDLASIWGRVTDIETPTVTRAIMHFSDPFPTAVPWLAFLASYVVPKAYMEKVGVEGFRSKPVGTGPYKLVEYQLNSRIVLERNDNYFGPKPAIKRVIIEIIPDPSARGAAVESGHADLTISIPIREVSRLGALDGIATEVNPFTRVIMLYMRGDLAFKDKNVRLAVHHAIDKQALSKAFYAGAARPLSVLATPLNSASSSEWAVSMSTLVSGNAERMSRHASMPERPGRRTSMITTSGGSADTALSAASASAASAMMRMPPTPSRMLLSPRRTNSWSSHSSTRITCSSGTSAL